MNVLVLACTLAILCAFFLPSMKCSDLRPIALACPSGEVTERGTPGAPGKRGAAGAPGVKGEQGIKGEKGQSDESREIIQRLQGRISELEKSNVTAQKRIYELEENLRTLGIQRSNCDDVYEAGNTLDGVYSIFVDGKQLKVYCEFQKNNFNWLVFQKRFSGDVQFYLTWIDYQKGFGEKTGEFWLGLDNLHSIVSSGSYMLRVDLEDWEGNTAYAEYSSFTIGDVTTNYRLRIGDYNGTAGDSLSRHNHSQFSTKDRENDSHSTFNCATRYKGAYWYSNCVNSNLNGLYLRNGQVSTTGMGWYRWKNSWISLKKSEMKIRRVSN